MPFGPAPLVPYGVGSSGPLEFARYHPYHSDSELDSLPRSSLVPVRTPPLRPALRLQDEHIKCDRNLGWNIDWAVAFLVDHLSEKKSPGAVERLHKIRKAAHSLQQNGLARDIPYRLFNSLDDALFDGHLKNAVYLGITSLGPDVSGATHTRGWALSPNIKRISIMLNGDVLSTSRDILGILIHQMIHAYFLVACGPQDEKETAYGRLSHGLPFGKLMSTIRKLADKRGNPLWNLDFGHTLGRFHNFRDNFYYRPRNRPHNPSPDKWYCSQCYSGIEPISESDIDEYFGVACKPLYDLPDTLQSSTVQIYNEKRHELETEPRGQVTLTMESSEFLFQDRPVLVPNTKIDKFFSISRAFDKSGSRYMEIHEDVSADTFLRFLELLHTGTYGPDPKPITITGNRGPPVIRPPNNSPPYLLTDIRIYKMGCLMGFDELKGTALERMYRPAATHEDPVTLLSEIYEGGEPDADLKTWVRKFLLRTPTAADGGTDWISNLVKLECDMLPYKCAFVEAVERIGSLENEVLKVREVLVAVGQGRQLGMYSAAGAAAFSRAVTPARAQIGGGMGVGVGAGLGAGLGVGAHGQRIVSPLALPAALPARGASWGGEGIGGLDADTLLAREAWQF
ncbi:hypothetical protein BS50DRAFT_677674 [Corynespora cassiicola Philippines]|uniref:Uncharacterized protein n=1 Tax=Corynespora cassiicola Philippines TaxID=1448308 RepID=A0A2T2NM18_CORCC|nr:hypothetical protein BS50DRAFT_677674 [Corynespora cassiicola Philippines]